MALAKWANSAGDNLKLVTEGRRYSINVEFALPTNSAESPIAILTNPGGSGKVLYISRFTADVVTKGQQALFRIYVQPTITANGTAISVGNDNIGASNPATVVTSFSGPTISANGTRARTISIGKDVNSLIVDVDYAIAVNPGITLLITGTPTQNNTSVAVSVAWAELP